MKCIFLHRRDFRIHDNNGLAEATKMGSELLPLVIVEQEYVEQFSPNDPKIAVLQLAVDELAAAYAKVQRTLTVLHGSFIETIVAFAQQSTATTLFTNESYEPLEIEQTTILAQRLSEVGITLKTYKDHVFFAKNEILKKDLTPYSIFTPYKNRWLAAFDPQNIPYYPSLELLSSEKSLQEKRFVPKKLQNFPAQITRDYATLRDFPALSASTQLSVDLRYGKVSIRQVIQILGTQQPKLLDAFIWRDFYQMILAHFPHAAWNSFKPAYDAIQWENDEELFTAWCEGKTGFLIVDAGMRELNATGFMHNRVRMIVASFLCKDLQIDWRWGASYFASKLLDYELASNSGGWQWAASSGCDAAPYFRIFNPTLQAEKFDKQQVYIRKWITELDTELYPSPIVKHAEMKEKTLNMYKKALKK